MDLGIAAHYPVTGSGTTGRGVTTTAREVARVRFTSAARTLPVIVPSIRFPPTARTVMNRVAFLSAAIRSIRKHTIRPDCVPLLVLTNVNIAGPRKQATTAVASAFPLLVTRMPTRMVSPLTSLPRGARILACNDATDFGVAFGVIEAEAADGADVPATLVAVTVKV